MHENQNIEWKEHWRDEYVKWICGFANADGGTILVGVNDDGKVIGIKNAKSLLEEIPNKTKDILGILVDVNIKTENGLEYLEIYTEPYPSPISYKGQYFYRSGSTKQELKGAALDKFLLRKYGKRWDSVPMPTVSISDLDPAAFNLFRKYAQHTNRISGEIAKDSNALLLEKLHLKTDTNHIKRAAVLLFHSDPEKFVTGAYVKIGFFNTDIDLAYQNEIHGNLFEQVEITLDLLLTKYLNATISYKGLSRIEKYPIPESALREAILNAVAHKDYSSGNPIQISVYKNKVMIWNEGELPPDWTVENLKDKHPSKPYNPDISNAFFRCGMIEAWGRGTLKMSDDCKRHKAIPPSFGYDLSGFVIEFPIPIEEKKGFQKKSPNAKSDTTKEILYNMQQNEKITIVELVKKIGVSRESIKRGIKKLKDTNFIEREGSDKEGRWVILVK